MTTRDDSEPAILRRRAKELEADGYAAPWVAAFYRAAEQLQAHRACAGDLEQQVLNAIADNRRLRDAIVRVHDQVLAQQPRGWRNEVLEKLRNTLGAVRPFGQGRRILSIEIGNLETRAAVEARVAAVLDQHFGGSHGQEHETDPEGEAAEPRGAGRHAD